MTQPLSPDEIAQLVEFAEGVAYADLFRFAPAELHMQVESVGSAIALVAETMDIVLFNRVIGLGLREPATEAMVDRIVARYRQAGIRNFTVQVSPTAQPAALLGWLTARNLLRRDNWAKVYRTAEAQVLIPTDLRIERIGRELADAFAEVACAAFEMPDQLRPWIAQSVGQAGWHHYLAFDGERPVATGALFVREDAGWLGFGSTLASHRRRGAQGAIMSQRSQDAADLGCRWLVTETGEDLPDHPNPSFRNMLRIGFELAYQRPNFIFTAD
jgi:hypothetical protein